MRKILYALLIAVLVFCSCDSPDANDVYGDELKAPLPDQEGNVLYVANKNSKTYHISSCYLAKSINEENRYETKDLSFLRSRKFTSCKLCISD